jgi:hypothetical protein
MSLEDLRDAFLASHPGYAFGVCNGLLCPLEAGLPGSPPAFKDGGPRYMEWVSYIQTVTEENMAEVRSLPFTIPGLTAIECLTYKMRSDQPFVAPVIPTVDKMKALNNAICWYESIWKDYRMSNSAMNQRNYYRAAIWCKHIVKVFMEKEGLTREGAEAVLAFLYEPYCVYPKNTLAAFEALTAFANKKGICVREAQTVLESHIPF